MQVSARACVCVSYPPIASASCLSASSSSTLCLADACNLHTRQDMHNMCVRLRGGEGGVPRTQRVETPVCMCVYVRACVCISLEFVSVSGSCQCITRLMYGHLVIAGTYVDWDLCTHVHTHTHTWTQTHVHVHTMVHASYQGEINAHTLTSVGRKQCVQRSMRAHDTHTHTHTHLFSDLPTVFSVQDKEAFVLTCLATCDLYTHTHTHTNTHKHRDTHTHTHTHTNHIYSGAMCKALAQQLRQDGPMASLAARVFVCVCLSKYVVCLPDMVTLCM